tara:strand:- start:26 stop:283 length:258 start_codon:yes stop_codon:yes gene_type:complete
MDNSEFNKKEFCQDDILKDEMMYLRLRLDSLEGSPIVMKLLIDLALKIDNQKDCLDLEGEDFLNATYKVNEWIDELEGLLNSTVH